MSEDQEKTEKNTSQSDWKQREMGALWRREGKQQNFLSGTLRIGDPLGADSVKEIKVVVFTNKGKAKNERAPDFIIYEDRPRDTEPVTAEPAQAADANETDEVPVGF